MCKLMMKSIGSTKLGVVMLTNKRVTLLIAAMVAGVFLSQVGKTWELLSRLHTQQVQANERFLDWRYAYEALLPVNAIWVKTYPARINDLVELYQRFNLEQHGLTAELDQITQTNTTKVDVRGVDVGLYSLCVGTQGRHTIRLSAPSVTALRHGVESLVSRKDVELGSLKFAFDKEQKTPYVDVAGMCLRVRGDAS